MNATSAGRNDCKAKRRIQSSDTQQLTVSWSRAPGHDFSKVRVYSDTRAAESTRDVNAIAYPVARDGGIGRGQFPPGTTPETPPVETQPTPVEKTESPTAGTEPTPMDNPPAQGPAIAVTNGWANPAGKKDRTTVGIGELSSFVVKDCRGRQLEK